MKQWNLSGTTSSGKTTLSGKTISQFENSYLPLYSMQTELVWKNHLSGKTTFSWRLGWSFQTGFTVFLNICIPWCRQVNKLIHSNLMSEFGHPEITFKKAVWTEGPDLWSTGISDGYSVTLPEARRHSNVCYMTMIEHNASSSCSPRSQALGGVFATMMTTCSQPSRSIMDWLWMIINVKLSSAIMRPMLQGGGFWIWCR